MATIDDILAAVEAAPIGTDGTLTLQASAFPDIDVMAAFFTNVVGEQAFPIRAAARAPGQATVVVTGQADFLGYTGLATTLSFAVQDGNVVVTLTGTIPAQGPIGLPVVTWVELDKVSLTTTVAEPFQLVSFQFLASIVLSGDVTGSVPIEITYSPPSQWEIGVAEQAATPVTADQLVALVGGHGLASFLPQQLVSILDGFTLADLGVTFDTGAGTVSQVTAALSVTNGWPVAPGIDLKPGLKIAIGVANPGDASTRQFTGVVLGAFDIDGTAVPVFVQADVTSQTTSWLVGLDPATEGVTIPSLSGIFTLAGGPGFAASLPSGLSQLPGIQISPLLIGFTLGPPAQLQQVQFGAATTSAWPVVAGFLTVEQLAFQFQLIGLSDGQRGIGCDLTCMIAFTDSAWLYFEIRKDPASSDWTLSGGLPPGHPLNLTDLVAKLLSAHVTLPANAPQLVLDTADVTVVPGRSVSFQAGSVTPWQLLDSVALTSWALAFSYDANASPAFTGSLSTTLTLAGVPVSISAGLDRSGAWSFSGRTSAVPIGGLLTELAGTFGISTVPAPVRSLELTSLVVGYNTGTSEFAFTCEAGFVVEATPVAVVVTITVAPSTQVPAPADGADPHAAVTEGTKGYSAIFTGQVTFAAKQFDIVFDVEDAGTDVLVADYVHTAPDPIELQSLVAGVSPGLAQAIPPGISIELEEVKFVFLKQTSTQWAFGLRLGIDPINLSELPIVGSKLPPDATLAIGNLQILYSSADLAAAQTAIINPLLPAKVTKLPDAVGEGISFDADVTLGTTVKHLHAGVTPPAPAPAAIPPAPSPAAVEPAAAAAAPTAAAPATIPASSTDPVKWLDVNKQFGIFSFQRVGVGYQDNVLEFALDASVALGPLAFSMQALTVGSPLTKFEPEFSLKGLALTFDRPPIAIGGAFLKVRETVGDKTFDSYYGELIVQVATFSLKALGGWAPDADPALFFIYLSIDTPLGGPPFLFVTGLAGGFGINSSLTLPTIDKVGSYPLLPGEAPAEQATPAQTIAAVIPALQQTFQPKAGEYWVAAGIAFTSFEMIQAQAVVSVAFGVDVQIGVVGTCAMTFPTGDPYPVAYVEIDVVASFTPSTGLLAVDGKLSPASYLFGGFVQLTGGFAFYAWFSGDKRGDFVVSLGGYHPAFDAAKAGYPAVPRLALAFSLGPVKVVGQAYFALTPSMFMAGLRLTATFAAGPVKAWFDAGVDFLIAWAPFHYEAHAWVTIGCSVDLGLFTLSVQIGADLQIWGPAFGGQALVDLDIVSFTIGFGAARSVPAPVGWDTFAANFLPPPQAGALPAPMLAHIAAAVAAELPAPVPNILKATVTAGQTGALPGVDWVLDPDKFRILIASTIPANHALWATAAGQTAELPSAVAGYQRAPAPPEAAAAAPAAPDGMLLRLDHDTVTYSDSQVWAPALNIGPMNESNVASYLTITLRRRDENGNLADYFTGVTVAPQLTASGTALWGPGGQAGDPNAQRLIPATLTGLAISPVPRHPDQVSDVTLESLLFGEGHSTGFSYQDPVVDQSFTVTSAISPDGQTFTIDVAGAHTASLDNHGYVLSALADPWVARQRSATLNALRGLGFTTAAADEVHLDVMAETALTGWPSATRIGSETWA